jgi:hypothetical protein
LEFVSEMSQKWEGVEEDLWGVELKGEVGERRDESLSVALRRVEMVD